MASDVISASRGQINFFRSGSAQSVVAFEALEGELCSEAHLLLLSNHHGRVFRSNMSLRLLLRTNRLLTQASDVTPEVSL